MTPPGRRIIHHLDLNVVTCSLHISNPYCSGRFLGFKNQFVILFASYYFTAVITGYVYQKKRLSDGSYNFYILWVILCDASPTHRGFILISLFFLVFKIHNFSKNVLSVSIKSIRII